MFFIEFDPSGWDRGVVNKPPTVGYTWFGSWIANIEIFGSPPTEESTRTFAPTTYRSDSTAFLPETKLPPAVGVDNLIAGSPTVD